MCYSSPVLPTLRITLHVRLLGYLFDWTALIHASLRWYRNNADGEVGEEGEEEKIRKFSGGQLCEKNGDETCNGHTDHGSYIVNVWREIKRWVHFKHRRKCMRNAKGSPVLNWLLMGKKSGNLVTGSKSEPVTQPWVLSFITKQYAYRCNSLCHIVTIGTIVSLGQLRSVIGRSVVSWSSCWSLCVFVDCYKLRNLLAQAYTPIWMVWHKGDVRLTLFTLPESISHWQSALL